MMDVSTLRADCTLAEIDGMVEIIKKYGCGYALAFPSMTPYLIDKLKGTPTITAGVIGFPAGGSSTDSKCFEAEELIKMGCGELDMVLNVGLLKSGKIDAVQADVSAVSKACGAVPLKVIMEAHYLTDEEIRQACEISIKAGATFAKTGTGWTPTGATLENITLIKAIVGDRIKVKASGGIQGRETLLEMYRRGATRFGIGVRTVSKIFANASRPNTDNY